jgi:hypothetical protein
MALDSSQLTVAGNGNVYVAPVGTTAPADVSAAWGAGWIELGYTTEDGVTFTDSKEIASIGAWQSTYPIDRRINTRDNTLSFSLMQWNDDNVKLSFGGGAVTTVSAGLFKYAPPAPEFVDYRAMGVEIRDGSVTTRFIVPKGLVTENVESNMTRSGAAVLPITFSVTSTGSGDPWSFITNDPALNPV